MMYRYTLVFGNGNTMGFENDQTLEEILHILNETRDTFVSIGTAALVQKLEIAAIFDNSQADRYYGGADF